MGAHQAKSERLTIYLVKDPTLLDEQIVDTTKAKNPVDLKISSGSARLYVKKSPPPTQPAWSNFLIENQDVPEDLFEGRRSEGAVLVFRKDDAAFALTFGTGFHMVDLDLVVRDFGLRVALNSSDPERLRSLDKSSYESNPLNMRSQSPRGADIFDLLINTETDLVYAITGTSTEPLFGSHVTGRDALTITPEITLDDLPAVLTEAFRRYDERLPDRFSWIEDLRRVKDSETLEILDMELSTLLRSDRLPDNIWLGEPEIVDWESQIGYSFDLRERTLIHKTLQLPTLIEYMAEQGDEPTATALRRHLVYAVDDHFYPLKKWTAYRCLYAEIASGPQTYILRNGDWHAIKESFIQRVDGQLSKLEIDTIKMPVYKHGSETEYNACVAADSVGYELLDRKTVQFGGVYDKIEFCDLVRNGRDLIHVKVYKNSATLSHLFAQGSVGAETFVADEVFRTKLNEQLPKGIKLKDPAARPNPADYRVVYAIVTAKDIPKTLPFFSKVTLKNAIASLGALGFSVAIAKIEIDREFLNTVSCKPSRRTQAAAPDLVRKPRRAGRRSEPPAAPPS
ncbi:sporadically distributed protein, TIGR04141 family [Trinickia symbiotica]|uniref:Sporadically distributed protein, TIGR04141 family n=1 Tax=Trinickia symbiotica TaxID=863227 RepID=A0A2T3XJS5_9BURK|nr:TIGR04141 family sporadically distributed protein [Trinickia symbiotica]PTB16780.1 sporadically distributed protein, TIGR04141 family [Trinickia symbiotica]